MSKVAGSVLQNCPQTAAQRKAAERARRRAAGLVKLEVWVTPEQRERLLAYIARVFKD